VTPLFFFFKPLSLSSATTFDLIGTSLVEDPATGQLWLSRSFAGDSPHYPLVNRSGIGFTEGGRFPIVTELFVKNRCTMS